MDIQRPQRLAALWICGWLALLLPALWLPIDLRITGPLVVFLPPLLLNWRSTMRFLADFAATPWRRRVLLALIGWVALAVALSAHAAAALATAAAWCFWALGAATVASLARAEPRFRQWFLWSLAASGCAAALVFTVNYRLCGASADAPWEQLVRPYPHFRYPGIHLLFPALAALGLHLCASSWRSRWGSFLMALASWSALLWSGSRAGMLSLGVGSAFLLCLRRREGTVLQDTARSGVLLIAALAVAACFEPSKPPLGWRHAFTRTVATTSLNEASSDRGGLWSNIGRHIPESPIWGHGPDSYRFLTPKAAGNQPHNVAIQFALEVGIPGCGLLLLLAALSYPWSVLARDAAPAHAHAAAAAIIAGAAAMSFFDGVLYHAIGLVPLTAALGLLLTATLPGSGSSAMPSRWLSRLVGPAVAAGCLVILLHTAVAAVQLGPVPQPNSATHRLVQAFPSTLFSYSRWVDAWEQSDPGAAEAACLWATSASDLAYQYHLRCAGFSAARSDLAQTLAHLEAAVATAPVQLQAGIAAHLHQIRTRFAPAGANQPGSNGTPSP